MGVCLTCNGNAGWLSHECSNCRAKREAVEAARAAEAVKAAELERRAQIDSMVDAALADLKARTDAGGTVHLVDCLVLPLDENGWIQPQGLDQLRDLALRGWEVVSNDRRVRTERNTELALSRVSLDCTQVLVQLSVSAANLTYLDGEIRAHFGARATADLDARG